MIDASPLAWYFMRDWLDNFAYRIGLAWWKFAGVGIGVVLLAMATVLWQTSSISRANPVESLRYE